MSIGPREAAGLALVALVVAGGGGYLAGRSHVPAQPIRTIVIHDGYFHTTTSEVLSTTVDSLRAENKLLVFSYKGSARVQADSRWLWVFRGHQELIVPAAVSYYLDLSRLSVGRDVTYDAAAKTVRVRLRPLSVGDIAFQPEAATTLNGGLLTFSEAEVEGLRKLNYASARRGMEAQAEQPGIVDAARAQAVRDVESYFQIPLRIAGKPDVKVTATFD